MVDTSTMIDYMLARRVGQTSVIEAPEDDPILLQAEADGYADRGDGCWLGRGLIQHGEKRIVRYDGGEAEEIVG